MATLDEWTLQRGVCILKQPGSLTWVMLNHSLDIIGPLWGPRLQGPLGCGQWELQSPGLICILGGGEKRNKAIRPGAANHHGHKLHSLEGESGWIYTG